MDYDKSLKLAMKQWLVSKGYDVEEVIDYNQITEESGYCDTCYSVDVIVEIDYNSSSKSRHSYAYYGGFADLIRELSDTEI